MATYGTFLVGSESSNYTLRVAHYYGSAGDAMSYHNGMMFSTYDRDNDLDTGGNCAQDHGAGFWYNNCYAAGVTVMTGQGGDFTWNTIALQWAIMLLTC